jgi:hypothetical protein
MKKHITASIVLTKLAIIVNILKTLEHGIATAVWEALWLPRISARMKFGGAVMAKEVNHFLVVTAMEREITSYALLLVTLRRWSAVLVDSEWRRNQLCVRDVVMRSVKLVTIWMRLRIETLVKNGVAWERGLFLGINTVWVAILQVGPLPVLFKRALASSMRWVWRKFQQSMLLTIFSGPIWCIARDLVHELAKYDPDL